MTWRQPWPTRAAEGPAALENSVLQALVTLCPFKSSVPPVCCFVYEVVPGREHCPFFRGGCLGGVGGAVSSWTPRPCPGHKSWGICTERQQVPRSRPAQGKQGPVREDRRTAAPGSAPRAPLQPPCRERAQGRLRSPTPPARRFRGAASLRFRRCSETINTCSDSGVLL